jgi:hypothetical protein
MKQLSKNSEFDWRKTVFLLENIPPGFQNFVSTVFLGVCLPLLVPIP